MSGRLAGAERSVLGVQRLHARDQVGVADLRQVLGEVVGVALMDGLVHVALEDGPGLLVPTQSVEHLSNIQWARWGHSDAKWTDGTKGSNHCLVVRELVEPRQPMFG